MSPSWTERLSPWRFGPKVSAGIAVGRREVCVAYVRLGEQGTCIQAIHTAPLADEMFAGAPTPAVESGLAAALAEVAADAKGKFISWHVALPDPTTAFAVFELDELPKSGKTRLDLVRWRFAREHSVDGETLDCVHQELGRENGKHLLLGQAVDGAWLRCIKQALRRAGIVPSSLNQGISYRFNQFHDRFAKEKCGAAMVVLDPDSWAVFLWDAAARPRRVHARWRANAGGARDNYDAIALEAERLILSHVRSGREDSVARVYAISHARELDAFAAALDRRLRESCTPLATPGADPDMDRQIHGHELASLSLAAAIT